MTTAARRQQLHHIIDVADDQKIEELYDLLQKDSDLEKYTPHELAEFYNRLDKYTAGEMPVFTVEEAHNYVRQHKAGK